MFTLLDAKFCSSTVHAVLMSLVRLGPSPSNIYLLYGCSCVAESRCQRNNRTYSESEQYYDDLCTQRCECHLGELNNKEFGYRCKEIVL
jgi:hypothetical protein